MKDEILKIQQKIKMKEAAKNLGKHYRLEESQELMNVPLGKLKFDSKMTKENYEKELLDFYYTFNDEPPTPKIFGEIGKIAERLFTNVSKHEGIAHELLVMPKIAEFIDKEIEKLRGTSTHGVCCTCQSCKNNYEDCSCGEIRILENIKKKLLSNFSG